MEILMLSVEGDGLGIATRLAQEGNNVKVFIKKPEYSQAGLGLVNRVESWRPHFKKADFIICDMVGFGRYEELFRESGKPVFSCSKFMDVVELDREKGIDLFQKVGIPIPQTLVYDNPQKASALVQLWEDPGYVIKPCGNIDTAKTSMHTDKESYEWALTQLDSECKIVVQKIVYGVEVSTEGWFNGRDWIEPFNHTFEEKRFLEGGKGAHTGCMGNVVIAAKSNDKLVNETVMKLTPVLKKVNYRGPVDINAIVNDSGIHALEISSRLGYDAVEALMEGTKEPLTDVFFETAVGVKKKMDVTNDYMIAVRLSVPPWPHTKPDDEGRGMPVLGINKENLKHLWLTDIYKEDGNYLYAASDGVVAKATAIGRDVREARNRVYRTVDRLSIPDVQYRADIGARVDKDIAKLKELGWLN